VTWGNAQNRQGRAGRRYGEVRGGNQKKGGGTAPPHRKKFLGTGGKGEEGNRGESVIATRVKGRRRDEPDLKEA